MIDEKSPFERLVEARVHAGFSSASEAARAVGVPPSIYIAHENGQNGLKFDSAIRYGKRFKVSPSWLMTGEGDGPGYSVANYGGENIVRGNFGPAPAGFGVPGDGIPELDTFAGMGGGGIAQEIVTTSNGQTVSADAIADYWRIPPGFLASMRMKTAHLVAIPVKGDSNEPTIRSSDIVLSTSSTNTRALTVSTRWQIYLMRSS